MNHAQLPSVATAQLPARYEAAKLALAECSNIDECKDWSDKAQALASYAKQSQDSELEKHAQRIRARAVRRCGELLKEIEKGHGQNQNNSGDAPTKVLTRKEAATQAGLSKDQAVQSIRVANVPESDFESQVECDNPPTITALAEQGKQSRQTSPVYEQQGMTKQEFQAGMYLAAALEAYVNETKKFDPQNVVNGRTDREKQKLRELIAKTDSYHDQLIAKL